MRKTTMSENAKDHRLEDILLYEQNLLEDEERRELEEHMRGCAECQATLQTAKKFLPMLHEALEPDEPSAEELLARAKAEMRRKAEEKAAAPASIFTRMRVAVVGFGLAAASAAFIAAQMLLRSAGPAMVAHGDADAGHSNGVMTAPRPQPQASEDGGVDGGGDTEAEGE
jgi:anti-sigma factor RsiW